jgi:putative tricarboxylic transport membrane protein
MKMKRAWQIATLSFLILAILTMIFSLQYPYMDRLGPGPGFFPFWLSLITAALSLILFIQTTLAKEGAEWSADPLPHRSGAIRIFYIFGALVGGLIFFEPLGFRLTLLLFLFILPLSLGMRKWWLNLVFAVAGSFGVFHIFYYWLKVPLPMGIFGI